MARKPKLQQRDLWGAVYEKEEPPGPEIAFLSACEALSQATDCDDKKERELLFQQACSIAVRLPDWIAYTFWSLYGATRILAVKQDEWSEEPTPKPERESALVKRFIERLPVLIPGAILVKHESDPHQKPDAWLELDGQLCPVEAKRLVFGESAAMQLYRYMQFYGCNKGFAVAKELRANLPLGMEFVCVD